MSTKLTKGVINAYLATQALNAKMTGKQLALHDSQPYYKLFTPTPHPYDALVNASKLMLGHYERFIALLLHEPRLGQFIKLDLSAKLNQSFIASESQTIQIISQINGLPSALKTTSALDLGAELFGAYRNAGWLRDHSKTVMINSQLTKKFKKKDIGRHLESPYIPINKECTTAFKELEKIAKLLLDEKIDGRTMRIDLGREHVLSILKGAEKDSRLDWFVNL